MAKKEEKPATSDRLSRIEQFLASAPTIAAGNARQPLGPPQGFYDEQGAVLADLGRPRDPSFMPYVTGDEWVPAFNVPPEDRDRLKARMNAAGLYGAGGYQPGSWTREDANAYQLVLESANGMGVRDPTVVIDNIASEAIKSPRVAGQRAPLVNRVPDQTTIRNVVRDTALTLTGMRLAPEQEENIVAAYRSYVSGLNQQEYALGQTGGPGGVTNTPMAVEDFAEGQLEAINPEGVQRERGLDFMDKLLQSATRTTVPPPDQYQGEGLPRVGDEVV